MHYRIYKVAVVVSLAILALGAGSVFASATDSLPVKATGPGTLGKTLTVTKLSEAKARLTITAVNGDKESIVVYGGDVRLALALTEADPGD